MLYQVFSLCIQDMEEVMYYLMWAVSSENVAFFAFEFGFLNIKF